MKSDYHQLGARTYDPDMGRFLQQDPLFEIFTGHSSYSFGFNNPVMFGDPSGLAPEKHQKGGGDVLLGSGSLAALLTAYTSIVSATYDCVYYQERVFIGFKEITGLDINHTGMNRKQRNYRAIYGYETKHKWVETGGGGGGISPSYGYGPGGGESSANDNGMVSYNSDPYHMDGTLNNLFSGLWEKFQNVVFGGGNTNKTDHMYVLLDREGANGAGHMAIILPDKFGNLIYYSKDGTSAPNGIEGPSLFSEYDNRDLKDKSVGAFITYINSKREGKLYDTYAKITLENPNYDLLHSVASSQIRSYYAVESNSCAHTYFAVELAHRGNYVYIGGLVYLYVKAGEDFPIPISGHFPLIVPKLYFQDIKYDADAVRIIRN